MIEVIYKEEKQEAKGNEGIFSIPRNVRQVGFAGENHRIYMEDYVYTFLSRLSRPERHEKTQEEGRCRAAVLTGETKWAQGTTYLFIRGAIEAEDMEAAPDHIDFSEKLWEKINEEKEKYFPEQEVTGWFFSAPQLAMAATETMSRVHLKYFGGEKVLMLMDPGEQEDAFFYYENGYLMRQTGYYIFYEKNTQMQTYMIERNQTVNVQPSESVDDEAVKNFRKIIKGKRKEEEAESHTSVFSYAATACLALAVLTVGVNFYQNYRSTQINRQARAVSSVAQEEQTEQENISGDFSQEDAGTSENGKSAEDVFGEGTGQNMEETASGGTGEASGKETKQEDGAGTSLDETDSGTGTGTELGEADNGSTESTVSGEAGSESAEGTALGKTGNGSAEGTGLEETDNGSAEGTVSGETGSESTEGTAFGEADDGTGETETVYQEESDIRKARRKEALAQKDEDTLPTGTKAVHSSYVIRPGDTLYQISIEKYGSVNAVNEICRLNNLAEDEIIYPGQIIVLP